MGEIFQLRLQILIPTTFLMEIYSAWSLEETVVSKFESCDAKKIFENLSLQLIGEIFLVFENTVTLFLLEMDLAYLYIRFDVITVTGETKSSNHIMTWLKNFIESLFVHFDKGFVGKLHKIGCLV